MATSRIDTRNIELEALNPTFYKMNIVNWRQSFANFGFGFSTFAFYYMRQNIFAPLCGYVLFKSNSKFYDTYIRHKTVKRIEDKQREDGAWVNCQDYVWPRNPVYRKMLFWSQFVVCTAIGGLIARKLFLIPRLAAGPLPPPRQMKRPLTPKELLYNRSY